MTGRLDPHSRAFKACPFPLYAELRRASPVTALTLSTGLPCWVSTGYEASRSLLGDGRLSKNSTFASVEWHRRHPNWDGATSRPVFDHLLTVDRPDHSRLRRLVARSFARSTIAALEPRLAEWATTAVAALPIGAPFDAVEALALPYPLEVISHLFGVPVEDRGSFRRWSQLLMSPASHERTLVARAGAELTAYLERHARTVPQDGLPTLFGDLVAARDRGELSETELIAMGFIILVAGHETTSSLIALSLLTLARDPRTWTALRRSPESLPAVVDELLRTCSPIDFATPRFAKEDIVVGSERIRRGDVVYVGVAAASRDPHVFSEPDEFQPYRWEQHRAPTLQLAFGHGPHRCLGEHLARAEITAVLRALLERCTAIHCLGDERELPWAEWMLMRGVHKCPVVLHR